MDIRSLESNIYTQKASGFIGLDRIRQENLKDKKMIGYIAEYNEKFEALKHPSKNLSPEKYIKIIHDMFIALGEIEHLGARKGKDYSLDILQALKELHVFLSKPEFKLNEQTLTEFWASQLSEKETTKDNFKHVEPIKAIYRMLLYGYTPYLMKDVVDGVFAVSQVKEVRPYGEVGMIKDAYRLNEKIEFLNTLMRSEAISAGRAKPLHFKKSGIFTPPTSPTLQKKAFVDLQKEQKEAQEKAKQEAEPHLSQAFCDCERVIQQAKQILNDPEFIALNHHELTEQLNLIIAHNLSLMQRIYKRSETLHQKLAEDQKMYAMADKIMTKIAQQFESIEKFGMQLKNDSSPSRQDSANALQVALNSGEANRYEVKNLAGGNSTVFLIKDTTDGSTIVFRERELLTAELSDNLSCEQLRLQVTNSLSLAPTVTQLYVLAPLRGEDMGHVHFGYGVQTLELSEPVTGGNFLDIMQNLRREYKENPSPEKLKEIQLTFLDLAMQTIGMTAYFIHKDRVFTDLKGKNLLMSSDGLLKVSDNKTLVPIGPEIHNPLQVTPGFVDQKVMTPPRGRKEPPEERVNRLRKLQKEALVSTLWQLANDLPHQRKDQSFADLYQDLLVFLKDTHNPLFQGELGKLVHDVLYEAFSSSTATGLLEKIDKKEDLKQAVHEFREAKKAEQVAAKSPPTIPTPY